MEVVFRRSRALAPNEVCQCVQDRREADESPQKLALKTERVSRRASLTKLRSEAVGMRDARPLGYNAMLCGYYFPTEGCRERRVSVEKE